MSNVVARNADKARINNALSSELRSCLPSRRRLILRSTRKPCLSMVERSEPEGNLDRQGARATNVGREGEKCPQCSNTGALKYIGQEKVNKI